MFDLISMLNTWPVMLYGMAGIFLVILVLCVSVVILNKLFPGKSGKDDSAAK